MSYVPLIKKISDPEKSSFRKYQDLFVGSRSIYDLIKYETMLSILGPMPGALGIFLRSKFYRWLVRESGKNVFFGRSMTIRAPNNIRLGSNLVIDDNVVLDAKGDPDRSWITCGNEVDIGRNTILSGKNGSIKIGNFVSIGRNVLLSSTKHLQIGNNCNIGPYACILAAGHGWQETDVPIMLQLREVGEIIIEENVWIGAHVTVMDGVTIGSHSIVSAGSVVSQDIPSHTIAAGIPARPIKRRDRGEKGPGEEENTFSSKTQPLKQGQPEIDSKSKVVQALWQAVDEINQQLPSDQQLEKSLDAVVADSTRTLDSLSLLNFIVTTEQKIYEEFGKRIRLVNDSMMSGEQDTFRTMGALANHISVLLMENADER